MNSYCQYVINDFHSMFNTRKFEQKDVIHFIMTIREYTDEKSILRELGDFIAHIKKKDRGKTISLIERNSIKFNTYIDDYFNKKESKTLKFEILDIRQLAIELNILLNDVALKNDIKKAENINCFIEEINQSFKEFVFCIIMFLSSCKIELYFLHKNGEYLLEIKKPNRDEIDKLRFRTLLPKDFLLKTKVLPIKVKYGGITKAYIDFEDMNYMGVKINTLMPILSLRNSKQNFNEINGISNLYAKRFDGEILAGVSYERINKEVTENDIYQCKDEM